MITLQQIRVGSIVIVRGGFGDDPPEEVVVSGVHKEIKNGRSGIDYGSHWAYLYQIEKVVKY